MAMVMCGFLCTGLLIICSEEGPIDDPGQCKENQAEHGALPGTGREPRENRLRQIPELKNFCRDRNKTNLEGDPRDAGDNKTADPHRDHQHGVERDRSTIYQRFVDVDLVGLNLKPTVKRVQRLRDAEKRGNLDDKTMRAILEDKDIQPVKPPEPPKPAPTQPDPPFPVASMVTPNVSPAPAPTTGTSPVTLAPPNMKPVMPEPPKQEDTARPPATQTVEKPETAPTSASNVIPISAESKQPGESKADEEPIAHNSQRDSMYSTKVVLGGDRLRKYFPDVSMTPDEIVDSIYSALEERRQREARMKQKTEILHPGKPAPTR